MTKRSIQKRSYAFLLPTVDLQKLQVIADQLTEGNLAFLVRKILRDYIAANQSLLKNKTKNGD